MDKQALVIGINNYLLGAPSNNLRDCVQDAKNMVAFLKDHLGFAPSDITLLTDGDATAQKILLALEALTHGLQPGDYRFFWQSSHGCKGSDGGFLLCAHDTAELGTDWDPATVVSHVQIHSLISNLPPGAIFEGGADACHAAGGEKEMDPFRAKFLAHSIMTPPPVVKDPLGAVGSCVPDQPLNAIWWAACRSDEEAADGGPYGGVLTGAWLHAFYPGISRSRLINSLRQIIKTQGYPQLPLLQCTWQLALQEVGKGFKG